MLFTYLWTCSGSSSAKKCGRRLGWRGYCRHHGGRRIESVPERVHPIHNVPIRRRTRRPLQVVFRAIGAPTQNPPRAGAIGSSRALGGKVPPGYVVDKRNTDGTITHPLLVRLRYLALVIDSEFFPARAISARLSLAAAS